MSADRDRAQWAESEEAITKTVLKLVKQNGRYSSLAVNMTALARAISSCKRQTRPPVREGSPHQQTRNCLTVTKRGLGPQMRLDTKTDWPTDRRS
jgi:hypothetical protein